LASAPAQLLPSMSIMKLNNLSISYKLMRSLKQVMAVWKRPFKLLQISLRIFSRLYRHTVVHMPRKKESVKILSKQILIALNLSMS